MLLSVQAAALAADASRPRIELKLRPRVCTLSDENPTCNTTVHAQWRSSRNESLCLLIVDRPQMRQCWENHKEGVYSVEVSFSEDLVVELRDAELRSRAGVAGDRRDSPGAAAAPQAAAALEHLLIARAA